jgi:hypothetical protein
MWPIVVDTEFTSTKLSAPVPAAVNPAASLFPVGAVDWTVKWTITRGDGKSGLTDLITAQKAIDNNAQDGDLLKLKSKTIWVDGQPVQTEETSQTGNSITQSITSSTSEWDDPDDAGNAAFNLEYIPFNLDTGTLWTSFNDEAIFDLNGQAPVWIIRNGVNDAAQDAKTDFNEDWWDKPTAKNGNGAVGLRYRQWTRSW